MHTSSSSSSSSSSSNSSSSSSSSSSMSGSECSGYDCADGGWYERGLVLVLLRLPRSTAGSTAVHGRSAKDRNIPIADEGSLVRAGSGCVPTTNAAPVPTSPVSAGASAAHEADASTEASALVSAVAGAARACCAGRGPSQVSPAHSLRIEVLPLVRAFSNSFASYELCA
jgi:hypothetical protein